MASSVSSDELRLETDDDLSEGEINFSNAQPIYGRHTYGSLNRNIRKDDLNNFSLLVLNSNNVQLNLSQVLDVLIVRYRLNFITSASLKVRRNPRKSIVYIYASYQDELNRFMNEINTVDGNSFILNDQVINVSLINNMIFGTARNSIDYVNSPDSISNLHFNFVPNHTISPSFNLQNIWGKIQESSQLLNAISGISLRLNVRHRVLYYYGSFILNDNCNVDNTLLSLRHVGISANRANFSSFILSDMQASTIRNSNGGIIIVNETLLSNNILSNVSTIDNCNQRTEANALIGLIPSIVQEVIRGLRVNEAQWSPNESIQQTPQGYYRNRGSNNQRRSGGRTRGRRMFNNRRNFNPY